MKLSSVLKGKTSKLQRDDQNECCCGGRTHQICLRQSLNGIFVLGHVHDWHSRNFSKSPLEILVIGGDNEASMLHVGTETI
jgi:hypothetical protein